MKKQLFFIPIAILFVFVFSGVSYAQYEQHIVNSLNRIASHEAERQTNELANIQKRGDTMISNRITSLNNLLTRINNDKRLSSDEKTSLASDIDTTISGLTTLKAKIDADTDATTARADVKSIVTSYRVYMIFEPKERYLVVINNLQTVETNIAGLLPNVQNLITEQKNARKDVTALENLYNDINTQISTISSTLTTDKSLVSAVSIQTTDPASVFTQVKQGIQSVRADFEKIHQDFMQMRIDFRGLFGTTITTTPSATPTTP
ncbi:MAG: hypothetical protein ACREGI_02700 [Candidatus Levyibacteriota bacterium]